MIARNCGTNIKTYGTLLEVSNMFFFQKLEKLFATFEHSPCSNFTIIYDCILADRLVKHDLNA